MLGKSNMGRMLESYERTKASLRARVEHPFRVIKCQFGFTKVRYQGLAKNTAQLGEDAPPFDGCGRIGAPEMGEVRPKRACRGESFPDSGLSLSNFSA